MRVMTASQIRKTFLDYFVKNGHIQRPSAPLLPDNDPTVLLTTAGMQPFKPYFLGDADPQQDFGGTRATSVQKCFRTSDIDQVGDASHLTFFEMLGNFSFGDYDKIKAIDLAWEFLTKELHLPAEKLWATIYEGDETVARDTEAEKAWLKYLPPERITACGQKDNFWGPPGKTGPCGPCSEVHYQLVDRPKHGPNETETEFVEIWNLVFMEYFKDHQAKLSPLPKKNVDTGMGLERLSMVINGTISPFETDSYAEIIKVIKELPDYGSSDEEPEDTKRARIVADHIRGAVFLLADGVEFSNKDQGYILRRIVRRAADQFMTSEFSFVPIVDTVVAMFGGVYPELTSRVDDIKAKLEAEREQYNKILDVDVQSVVEKMRRGTGESAKEKGKGLSHQKLSAEEAFQLYSTHGISLDRLTRLKFVYKRAEVEEKIKAHQDISRAGATKKFGGHGLVGETELSAEDQAKMTRLHTATHLLHAALRQVLGSEVSQQGSDINPERLRFDFSFPRKMTDEEKAKVEAIVNEKISADMPVTVKTMPYQAAIDSGALAFFRDKYPAEVTVYSIGDYSKELCGGPHITHTGEIGKFKLTGEQSVGRGVRRIKGGVA